MRVPVVTPSEVTRYVMLPGIIPRVRTLASTPFSFLAALFAQIFLGVKLLPVGHPYTLDQNYGSFGILDVMRAAAAQLKFDRHHIDQVAIFFIILSGWVTFLLLLGLCVLNTAFIPSYAAMPTDVAGLMANIYAYTETPNPGSDIAMTLLDRTLGITGSTDSGSFFGSDVPNLCPGMELGAPECIAPPPFPSAYHTALHMLLAFYSRMLFLFAVLYFLYLLAVVVMATSIKGKPFGEKMNTFWVPLRLVMALGMLVPVAPHMLNTSQYIVLYAAKVGSAFATNGWLYYNQFLEVRMGGASMRNPIGTSTYTWDPQIGPTITDSSPLAAKLNPPNMGDMVRFLHVVSACEYYYERMNYGTDVTGYFVANGKESIPAYSTNGGGFTFPTYQEALDYFEYKNIVIYFGIKDPVKYRDRQGNVDPVCGQMVIPVSSARRPGDPVQNPGAERANELYYLYTIGLMDDTTYPRQLMRGFASQMIETYAKLDSQESCKWDSDNDGILNAPSPGTYATSVANGGNMTELGPCEQPPPPSYMRHQVETFQTIYQTLINDSNTQLAKVENFSLDDHILDRGWAGAGIWYERIAQLNGMYVTAVQQIPYGNKQPRVMTDVIRAIAAIKKYVPSQGTLDQCAIDPAIEQNIMPNERPLMVALCRVESYMADTQQFAFKPDPASPNTGVSGLSGCTLQLPNAQKTNVIMMAINTLFDMQFLFSFFENKELHPLAKLTTFGRTLLEKTGRNMLTGSTIAAAGAVIDVGNSDLGSSLRKLSAFYLTIASFMFTAGFMLYYVFPLLPFIYFFMAVIAWAKAVFEGLIGAPLWALAHVRMDGNGLPSGIARNGYLTILEIVLRPIVTVFALLGAMAIFSAAVNIFDEAMAPLLSAMDRDKLACMMDNSQEGSSLRGVIDVLFFLIVQILVVYMLANSCFKLIDTIPARTMRWIGGSGGFAEKAKSGSNEGAGAFISNSFFAVGNPAKGIVDKVDNYTYDVASTAAKFVDEHSNNSIAKQVQNVFGKDREGQIKEGLAPVQELSNEAARHLGQAQKHEQASKKAKEAGDTQKQEQLEMMAKRERALYKIYNPVLLFQNKIASDLDDDLRALAMENADIVKKATKGVRGAVFNLPEDGDPDVDKTLLNRLRDMLNKSLSKGK